jgi:hypothetical protein
MVYNLAGFRLPREPQQQLEVGETIDFIEHSQVGDVAFFENNQGRITHSGILMPNGQIIHANGGVRIDLVDNKLHGTVVKLFREPGENPEPLCDGCKDYRKDKPVLGMTIMSGLKKSSSAGWEGGEIIDPADGSVYKVKVELKPDGKALDVRGYIGLPLIGRTQTWVRD